MSSVISFVQRGWIYLQRRLIFAVASRNWGLLLKAFPIVKDPPQAEAMVASQMFSKTILTRIISCPSWERCLVLSPHPDDEVIGAGGTLLQLKEQGCKINIAYMTSTGTSPEQRKAIAGESEAVLRTLDASAKHFGFQPGNIPLDEKTISSLKDHLLVVEPDVVLLPFILDDHDDHRRLNHLLSLALRQMRNSPEIWWYQVYSLFTPSLLLDISIELEAKRSLIQLYKSVPGNRDWSHYACGYNALLSRYAECKEPRFYEGFIPIPANRLIEVAEGFFAISPQTTYRKYYGREDLCL